MIISEPPLFTLPRRTHDPQQVSSLVVEKLRALEKDQQRDFFALSNNYKGLSPFMGIVKTNAMPLGANASSGGIFPKCSRFNHSCCSNAEYSWCAKFGVERVFAVKDIREGEEISVSYLSEPFWATPRTERQRHLLDKFNFHCCCDVCSQNTEETSANDSRRRSLSQLDAAIGDGILIVTNLGRALKFCKDVLHLLDEEGQSGLKVYTVYYDAFQVCVAHSDFARASAMARLAKQAKSLCQGNDADGIEEEVERYIQSPQTHRLAGTTKRWMSKVVHARTPESEGFEEWLWRRAG
ncbi:hypothetical protein MMC28_006566 [Mycoblastus sanguinarius]|nr:hypothetical protein [Mycoblastus sanguinarius]